MGAKVLVLGAGFAGLELCSILSDELGETIEATLIDKGGRLRLRLREA